MTEFVTIGQAGAVIWACWAIISGIGAWKREFIGKRRIELAEQILSKFFEVKDAIAYIRNPWSSPGDGESRERAAHESEEETRLLNRGYISVERYGQREAAFAEFNVLKYRCMAAFGAHTEAIFTETTRLTNTIFVSARMLATHYWPRQGRVQMTPDEATTHLEEMRNHEAVLWDHGQPDDPTRVRLGQIQAELESVLAPAFEDPNSLYTFLTRRRTKPANHGLQPTAAGENVSRRG